MVYWKLESLEALYDEVENIRTIGRSREDGFSGNHKRDDCVPDKKDIPKFLTILKVYGQQKYMLDYKVHSVPDRIMSISQP